MTSAPVTVAIIDDHPMSAEGLRARFAADGLRVTALVQDVESLAPEVVPDVLVCDLRLPGQSPGQAVTQLVRRGGRVLAMSGNPSPDVVLEAVAQGARGYLSKDHPTGRFTEAVTEIAATGYYVSARLAAYFRDDARRRPLDRAEIGRPELDLLDAYADGDRGDEIVNRTGLSLSGIRDSTELIFSTARERRHHPRYRPTPREEQVLILAGCAGLTNRAIARELGGISEETITVHLSRLRDKYRRTHTDVAGAGGLSPRAAAGQWAHDLGLCP